MLISTRLTVGQITFLLRLAIQILTYAGLFFLSIIILSRAPRVASFATHDVLNRIVGRSTSTLQSVKWLFSKTKDPVKSHRLTISILLFTLFSGLVALSDIGFLGFHACFVPQATILERPASVGSLASASSLVQDTLAANVTAEQVKTYRCDNAEEWTAGKRDGTDGEPLVLRRCTDWHNSTYADPTLYEGINSTDSEAVLSRFIRPLKTRSGFEYASFLVGVGPTRITKPTLSRGVVVAPHDYGVTGVFGVPDLGNERTVELPQTLAVEGEMGCLRLGMYAQHNLDATGLGLEIFDTTWDTSKFFGPEYMRPILEKYGQQLRDRYQVLYDNSTLDADGFIFTNTTRSELSTAAQVVSLTFGSLGINDTDSTMRGLELYGNCTADLRAALGVPWDPVFDRKWQGNVCQMLALTGSDVLEGFMYTTHAKFICATSQMVNMVAATVSRDVNGTVSLNTTRLPSDLHQTKAQFWHLSEANGTTTYNLLSPYIRYTLSPNPNGNLTHYTVPREDLGGTRTNGIPTSGQALSQLAHAMLTSGNSLNDNKALVYLDEGYDPLNMTAEKLTRWAGEIGASQIIHTLSYNGWAAQTAPQLSVLSTGGKAATCYKPPFALGFVPLILASLLIIFWSLLTLLAGGFAAAKALERLYGGLAPLRPAVCPQSAEKTLLMQWESIPEPHLEVVGSNGQPVIISGDGTAGQYFKSAPTHKYG